MVIRSEIFIVEFAPLGLDLEDSHISGGSGNSGCHYKQNHILYCKPVSYTHLDVYKRQQPDTALFRSDAAYR